MGEIERQIIAMGDGGTDDKVPFVDLYILAQAKKPMPKICFLPTASGDNMMYANYFKELFSRYPCVPSYLSLFHPTIRNIRDYIMAQDIIYVGGGHSKSMLGVWREWGLDKILREAYESGVILSGGSAGSVCWFEQCITDSIPGALTVMNCLGILPYSNSPHFGSRERRDVYATYIIRDEIKNGYAADDFAALHFVNGSLKRCISGRPNAKCYKLGKGDDGQFYRKRLKTYFLGVKQYQDDMIFDTPCFAYLKEEENEEKHEEIPQPQETKPTPQLPESTNATDSDSELPR